MGDHCAGHLEAGGEAVHEGGGLPGGDRQQGEPGPAGDRAGAGGGLSLLQETQAQPAGAGQATPAAQGNRGQGAGGLSAGYGRGWAR